MAKKEIDYQKYPIRVCHSCHGCEICRLNIYAGQKYYDGGYNRRAHVECVTSTLEVPNAQD